MAKPFVSYDGADEHGVRAEVWVQTGTGTVTAVEGAEDASKHNAMVLLRSDHASVKRPIKGWLSKKDPLYPVVVGAAADGREVEYRVESQRKHGVERSLPITELRADTETAGAHTISILAAIDGAPSLEAVTDPAEDPAAGGRIPAQRATAAGTAPDEQALATVTVLPVEQTLTALATARRTGLAEGVVDAAAALALVAGATAKQVAEAGFTGQPRAERLAPRRAYALEAAPHVRYNSDNRVNLGSWAVQAAFTAERVALDILAEAEQRAYQAHNAAVASGAKQGTPMAGPVPVDLADAAGLARLLLGLADRVQVGAYGGGRPDRMATSHTRARALVFDAVRTRHAVPFGATVEARRVWVDAVVSECVQRFRTLVLVAQELEEALLADEDELEEDGAPQAGEAPEGPEPSSERQHAGAPDEQVRAAAEPADRAAERPAGRGARRSSGQRATGSRRTAPEAGDAAHPIAAAAPATAGLQVPAAPGAPGVDEAVAASTPTPTTASATASRRPSQPRPPLPGEEGFTAPSARLVARFAALAKRAGFTPAPDSPVVAYLGAKFGVHRTRDVHALALEALVRWYEQREDGVAAFRRHVLAAAPPASERRSA